jgi:hypothetical protein
MQFHQLLIALDWEASDMEIIRGLKRESVHIRLADVGRTKGVLRKRDVESAGFDRLS